MTNAKSTLRALTASILALVVCCAMLVGSTFAWFSDEGVSSGNKIEAGTLKIDMLVRDANGEYQSVKESKAPIFNYDRWEPGYTAVANVKVANRGTLALQYNMQIITEGVADDLLNGDLMLSDVIDVYYAAKEVILADRDAFDAALESKELKHVGTLTDVIFGGTMVKDTLLEGEEDYATIVLKMQETAGNEYQGLSVGTAFDLKIYATQYTYEKDSFDDQYDKIELPGVTMLNFDPDMLQAYKLDAGCAYMSVEEWDLLNWGYDAENDKVIEGTPEYAYYFVDFVVSFDRDHAAGEVGLWGYYEKWGEEETFTMDAITAGTEYRVIEIAGEKLGIPMGSISYRQLLDDVKTFSCGVTENSLADGETMTVTLRMYKTALNGTSFAETGEFYDVAVYVYTK